MDAIEKGAKLGEQFRHSNPVLYESLTQERYRSFGELKAKQLYATPAKQAEFVQGWIAINQQFFRFLADGPRRRVSKISFTIECNKCGSEEEIEAEGSDIGCLASKYRDKPCPVCQKAARHIDDEFNP